MGDWKAKFDIIWRHWMDQGNRHSEVEVEWTRKEKLMRAVIQSQATRIMELERALKAARRRV